MGRKLTPGYLLATVLAASICEAQVLVNAPILIDAATAAQNQVHGLDTTLVPSAALTAHVEQAGRHRSGTAATGTVWAVDIPGLAGAPTPGTQLIVRSPAPFDAPVQMTVNGHGPYALTHGPGQAVPGATIHEATMLSVVFDGSGFQLLNSPLHRPRACPTGMVALSDQSCIGQNEHPLGTMTFFDGVIACAAAGGRLCSWGEWVAGCMRAVELGLEDMHGNHEWTDDAVNEDNLARVVGGTSSCHYAAAGSTVSGAVGHVRCCYTR